MSAPMKKTADFKIRKGVTLPPSGKGGIVKYPFRGMEVGDCFHVPVGDANAKKLQASLSGSARAFAESRGWAFTTRRCELGDVDGIGVWRVK